MRNGSPWFLVPLVLAYAPPEAGGAGQASGIPGRAELRIGGQLLTVPVPLGWTVEVVADGIRLGAADAARRRVATVLHLAYGDGTAGPAGNWPDRHSLGNRTARVRITRGEGGSGGDEFELAAWVPCGDGHLHLRYLTQVEQPSGPDLRPAWSVLEGTECRSVPEGPAPKGPVPEGSATSPERSGSPPGLGSAG